MFRTDIPDCAASCSIVSWFEISASSRWSPEATITIISADDVTLTDVTLELPPQELARLGPR